MTTWTALADPAAAAAHFTTRLAHETDCSDVARAMSHGMGGPTLVLLDARSAAAYDDGHLPDAVRLEEVTTEAVAGLVDPDRGTVFVTYCWGPHCNGATKLAARVAQLGFPVREMLGGTWGWQLEGFDLLTGPAGHEVRSGHEGVGR